MPRPIHAEIDLAALKHNLDALRKLVGKTKIWSVIKANAYGHGIENAYAGLQETDGFAVLDFNEAIKLRDLGWKGPILMLEGFFDQEDLTLIDHYNLTTTVHSFWQLSAIAEASLKQPINIYLKSNTGMNRLGFAANRLNEAWFEASSNPKIGQITLMTHFANAGEMRGIDEQMHLFSRFANAMRLPMCIANSAATILYPKTHADWVRPGLALYGASPTGNHLEIIKANLKPVMSLKSKLIAIQSLDTGSRVGYGGTYKANRSHSIGIVACGYSDGYPQHAPGGTPVIVDGRETVTVGKVSMNMLAVDLSSCPKASIGSDVELWGNQLSVDRVAQSSQTLSYELLSSLAPRVDIKLV